jgi:uncharacterized protein (TIGR02391 family)
MAQYIKRPILNPNILEAVCKSIGDTYNGISGTEIGKILSDCNIEDISPELTKWRRLYNAFIQWQNKNHCSNHILKFIQAALSPVRYLGKEEIFQQRRHNINKPLAFIGIQLNAKGKYESTDSVSTISEAEQKANHFKYKLDVRNVHTIVLEYCKPELLAENYFHSVFEAIKSIAQRLRQATGLYADGNELVDIAFSTKSPLIKINLLRNDTERSEHLGLMNIIKGLFGIIRNPTAHEPKLLFEIGENEALDLMIMISYVHRRLDKAL